jgi:hypothetical protein
LLAIFSIVRYLGTGQVGYWNAANAGTYLVTLLPPGLRDTVVAEKAAQVDISVCFFAFFEIFCGYSPSYLAALR